MWGGGIDVAGDQSSSVLIDSSTVSANTTNNRNGSIGVRTRKNYINNFFKRRVWVNNNSKRLTRCKR